MVYLVSMLLLPARLKRNQISFLAYSQRGSKSQEGLPMENVYPVSDINELEKDPYHIANKLKFVSYMKIVHKFIIYGIQNN